MFKDPDIIFNINKARQIRKHRADLKKRLKKRLIDFKELIKNDNYKHLIENMYIYDILISLPGFGVAKTVKIMKKLKINKCKRFKGLGKIQKSKIKNFFNLENDF